MGDLFNSIPIDRDEILRLTGVDIKEEDGTDKPVLEVLFELAIFWRKICQEENILSTIQAAVMTVNIKI